MSVPAISAPSVRANSASAGPLWSCWPRSPRVLLIVMIAARIASGQRLRGARPILLAAGLLEQSDLLDRDPALDALDHVVDGERRDGTGHERFHLDTGLG